jgi:hypothetical protein
MEIVGQTSESWNPPRLDVFYARGEFGILIIFRRLQRQKMATCGDGPPYSPPDKRRDADMVYFNYYKKTSTACNLIPFWFGFKFWKKLLNDIRVHSRLVKWDACPTDIYIRYVDLTNLMNSSTKLYEKYQVDSISQKFFEVQVELDFFF